MHIKYHVACGIALDVTFKTYGIMTLFSILPDAPLIFNEIKLIREKKAFDPNTIDNRIMNLYRFTHGLPFLSILALYLDWTLVLAFGIHQVADWFTHTGRFASQPLFPFHNYTVPFGREVLK